ncbi:acyltransferase family protein [Spirosoma koreense]
MQPTVTPSIDTIQKDKNYIIQLDGVRFIAVALVLFDHWTMTHIELPVGALGALGVTVFFVLSGFLITRILLSSRDKLRNKPNGGLSKYLKTFYIRRTIRIFPVYYLTLFVLALINEPPVRQKFAWLALYATNIYIALYHTWLGTVDHLWSLAVEEQVYLCFPLLLFFIPRRYIPLLSLGMIVGSVALRYVLYRAHAPWFIGYVSTPTCLDSFGLGALMAYGWLYQRDRFVRLFQPSLWVWLSLLGVIGVGLLNNWVAIDSPRGYHNVVSEVWERLAASVFGFFLIGRTVLGFGGIMQWILENPVSQYLGRISYGLYLYHNFVFNVYHTQPTHFTVRAWRRITDVLPFLHSSYFFPFMFYLALTILIATVSWYLIEKPINGLKDKFSY